MALAECNFKGIAAKFENDYLKADDIPDEDFPQLVGAKRRSSLNGAAWRLDFQGIL